MRLRNVAVVLLVCLFLQVLEAQRRGGSRAPGSPSPQPLKGLIVTFQGALKKLTKKEMLIESDDNQLLTFRCSKKTKFEDPDGEIKPSEIDLESRVSVDASEDTDLKLTALTVKVESARKKTLSK